MHILEVKLCGTPLNLYKEKHQCLSRNFSDNIRAFVTTSKFCLYCIISWRTVQISTTICSYISSNYKNKCGQKFLIPIFWFWLIKETDMDVQFSHLLSSPLTLGSLHPFPSAKEPLLLSLFYVSFSLYFALLTQEIPYGIKVCVWFSQPNSQKLIYTITLYFLWILQHFGCFISAKLHNK